MDIKKHLNYALVEDSRPPMYKAMKYWGKKPHNIWQEFIECYCPENGVVLDPFVGSGVAAFESVVSNRRAIAFDINPSLFTKKGMTVLDPFVGSGTTLIACNEIGRNGIGIDLNPEYEHLFRNRLTEKKITITSDIKYLVGNSLHLVPDVDEVDYIVTSPPYFNILRNDSKGTRNITGKQYRMSARDGVEFYSDSEEDIGNYNDYGEFILALKSIMEKCFACLKNKKYCTIIMSDFTVNKKEQPVQGDITKMMMDIGFEFCGTTVLFQPVKPLYPFGYPYAYKINHHYQNLMTFRKNV